MKELLQIELISSDKQLPYLQDDINRWLAKVTVNSQIEIRKIFFPSGGVIAIIYAVLDPVKQDEIFAKHGLKK